MGETHSVGWKRAKVDENKRKIGNLRRANSDLVVSLREDILAGGSSDNPIRDFCTVCYGSWGPSVETSYIELDEKLRANIGAHLLVVGYSVMEQDSLNYKMITWKSVRDFNTYEKKWGISWGKIQGGLIMRNKDRAVGFPVNESLSMDGKVSGHGDYKSWGDVSLHGKDWKRQASGLILKDLWALPHLRGGNQIYLGKNEFQRFSSRLYGANSFSDVLIGPDAELFLTSRVCGEEAYSKGIKLLGN